jgi:DNA helicase II / ATP-dependent DNA helicase PcrA
MPSNSIILAAAGSRKTTSVVAMAMADTSKRTLIVTYTIENLATIRSYFIADYGMVPSHITLQSWYSFLLQEGVRPYQNALYSEKRIEGIFFDPKNLKFRPLKTNTKAYFLVSGTLIYKDHLSEFAFEVNLKAKGAVVRRLERMYDTLYIDEIQDMSGYDWELLKELLHSKIEVCGVGDPRQVTYSTNNHHKNSMYKGGKCKEVFETWQKMGYCNILQWMDCYRSNQAICDHADKVFPSYAGTSSKFQGSSDHDGVFKLKACDVQAYFDHYQPIVLRNRIDSNTMGLPACNIGLTKGKTFDRVLIFPTQPMLKYLISGNELELKDRSKSSLYVAITRARYSVAYVVADQKTYDQINLLPCFKAISGGISSSLK